MNYHSYLEPQELTQMSYKKSVKKNFFYLDFLLFLLYIWEQKKRLT